MSVDDQPLNDPRHTVVHEAGHAVIGRVLTLMCGGASIEADHESAGQSITEDHFICNDEWRRRGKLRTDDAALHGRIMSSVVG